MTPAWLTLRRGDAPLIVSIPHTGLDLAGLERAGWTALPRHAARPPRSNRYSN